MGHNGGGPPDKWQEVQTDNQTGAEVTARLNELARHGFYRQSVSAKCADGEFIFVGNYGAGEGDGE